MSEQRKSRKKQVSAGRQFLCWSLCYTICFVLLALIIWQPFYREGRSFIWGYDGLYQTYTAMQYYSRYWKEFFSSVLAGHPSLPMVDSTVGLGFDVFTSLNHYGFGDPLQLVSLLFTEETMEVGYAFLTLLRFYLAGLAFGAYAMFVTERKRAILPLLAGAISYCFCGFALYAGVRHPYFMNSLIYLPLLLLGAERILQGKRGTLLTLMVAVAACSDFYFLYILTFLTFSYALVRYFCRYACVPRGMGEKRGKEEEKGERKGKEREEREGR
ncbi:MAG: YfhO family protein, partial [bacterium]|nr:YfhO family protein [bacterium]